AFVLWAETEFELWHILVMPPIAAAVGGFLVESVPALYRTLAPAAVRREHALEAARAMFYTQNIHATQRRTGLFVFVALREGIVALVPDVALRDKVGADTLDG